jgi:hypothetical protein
VRRFFFALSSASLIAACGRALGSGEGEIELPTSDAGSADAGDAVSEGATTEDAGAVEDAADGALRVLFATDFESTSGCGALSAESVTLERVADAGHEGGASCRACLSQNGQRGVYVDFPAAGVAGQYVLEAVIRTDSDASAQWGAKIEYFQDASFIERQQNLGAITKTWTKAQVVDSRVVGHDKVRAFLGGNDVIGYCYFIDDFRVTFDPN